MYTLREETGLRAEDVAGLTCFATQRVTNFAHRHELGVGRRRRADEVAHRDVTPLHEVDRA